jgi:hypothetical protein
MTLSDRPSGRPSQRPSQRPSRSSKYENQSIPPSLVRSRAAVAAICLFLFGTFLVAGIVRSCRGAEEPPVPPHPTDQLPG